MLSSHWTGQPCREIQAIPSKSWSLTSLWSAGLGRVGIGNHSERPQEMRESFHVGPWLHKVVMSHDTHMITYVTYDYILYTSQYIYIYIIYIYILIYIIYILYILYIYYIYIYILTYDHVYIINFSIFNVICMELVGAPRFKPLSAAVGSLGAEWRKVAESGASGHPMWKTHGFPSENHRKTIGKWWFNGI